MSVGNLPHHDIAAEVRLCIGMIRHAIKDMRKPGLSHAQVSGCAWLASSAATRWFDAVGLDQRYALEQMDWTRHAQRILDRERRGPDLAKPLPRSHLRVLAEALEKLQGGE